MNTKTMRLPPRRVLTPTGTTNNKRKEREDPLERPKPVTAAAATTTKLLKPDKPVLRPGSEPIISATTNINGKGLEPTPSNQLLAGYLAHEYLTKGTLLGQPWAPSSRAENSTTGEKRKGKEEDDGIGVEEGEAAEAAATTAATTAVPCRKAEEEKLRYAEVTGLLKGGGTHLPGVVNPTQLARFLHL